MSEMRQEKLDELVSLTQDYINLQTHTSDDHSLNALEQHYNGQFEQNVQLPSSQSNQQNPHPASSSQLPSTSGSEPLVASETLVASGTSVVSETIIAPDSTTLPHSSPTILAPNTELSISSHSSKQIMPTEPSTSSIHINPTSDKPSSSAPDLSRPSSSNLPFPPSIFDLELEQFCTSLYQKVQQLHSIRYSFIEPYDYIHAWDKLVQEIKDALYKLSDGDLQDLLHYHKDLKGWVKLVNAELDQAHQRRLGRLSLTDTFHWPESHLRANGCTLDSVLSGHLKFSLAPGPIFIPKEAPLPSELEELKADIARDRAERDARLDRIEAKQDAISSDLKHLIALLTPKP
jgi:hypothetical protein